MTDRGQTSLSDLAKQLLADPERSAFVYVLLRRSVEGWTLRCASVLVDIEPAGWAEATWEYEEATFIACKISVAKLVELCLKAKDSKVALGAFEFEISTPSSSVSWQHEPAFARLDRLAINRPTWNYTITRATPESNSWDARMLVGTGCPSFTELSVAWRAFTEGEYSTMGAQTPSSDLASIRVAETRGWISGVHVTATELRADVAGDELAGCELELGGLSDRAHRKVDQAGTVTFSLSDGLPRQAWLWLKHGQSWLDYRVVDRNSPWAGDGETDVNIDRPVDPQAAIEALLASGEGPQLEFKSQLVEGRKLKTVAAFANGKGGTIVFGFDRDETTVLGIPGDPTKVRDDLERRIRAAVDPMPDYSITVHTLGDKNVFVLDVPPGQHEIYGIIPNSGARDKPEYYVRRGASTYPAQPEDFAEIIRKRATQAASHGQFRSPWLGGA
jgi:Putative DNA-binding domain